MRRAGHEVPRPLHNEPKRSTRTLGPGYFDGQHGSGKSPAARAANVQLYAAIRQDRSRKCAPLVGFAGAVKQ